MSWCHLTLCERETIANLYFAGHGPREIGRRLKRAASTISRELRRNSTNGRYRPSDGSPEIAVSSIEASGPAKTVSSAASLGSRTSAVLLLES